MTRRAAATVLHVDLDAFFVSMELLRRPELRGLPVIVAGGLGPRGVVNTASYEARRFGVRSAMPTGRARQLCPRGIFVESDWSYYAPASAAFHAILADMTPVVEPAGADEAYLDVAGCEALLGDARTIATRIRERVRAEIGITASVGVSTNKLVSKVASDAAKPDGIAVIEPGEEAAFFAPRAIRELPMVGPRTAATLDRLGARTIGAIAALPVDLLVAHFGEHGHELHARALGLHDAPVLAGRGDARSVSREITFGVDEPSEDHLRAVLRSHAERIAADLALHGRSARTIVLKVRFPPFETLTRSATTGTPFSLPDELYRSAVALFREAWRANGRRPIRLLGLGATNLQERARQLALGETTAPDRLAETLSGLRDRFGDGAVRRAVELPYAADLRAHPAHRVPAPDAATTHRT